MNDPPGQTHVLLVDDTRLMRALHGRILEADGHRVTTVSSGADALEVLARATPDLVILDQMMPDMSGADVLARMRSDPRLAAVPAVFLTASMLDVATALALGAADCLTKPIDRASLVARVRALLRPILAGG